MRERILALLDKGVELPAFPEVLLRLQKTMRDPDTSVAEIATIIELDPVLAGRVLRISNSVHYNRSSRQITSLPLAITRMGMRVLFRLVYSLRLVDMFSDCRKIDSRSFWRHSLAVALFTQFLGKRVLSDPGEEDVAYLSGLMHDVGIAVFAYLIPEEYGSFLDSAKEREQPLEVLEREEFGIDHPELGFQFIRTRWNVDEQVAFGVRFHHEPFYGSEDERRCEQLVNIANGICNNQGITNGIICYTELFNDSAWDNLRLSIADAEQMMTETREALAQAEEIMGADKY